MTATTGEIPYIDATGFSLDELKLLLGLVRSRRKRREKEDALLAPRTGQTREEFRRIEQAHASSRAFLRKTEDHLILAIGALDETELWPHEQERLAELRTNRRR